MTSNTRSTIIETMARAIVRAKGAEVCASDDEWPLAVAHHRAMAAKHGAAYTNGRSLYTDAFNFAESALAAYEAHLEASGMAVVGWQPIESAPKDGTFIDLWLGNDEDPHRRTDCYWGRPHHECGEYGSYCDNCPPDRDMWVDPLSMGHEDLSPTHWMPAALPPRSE